LHDKYVSKFVRRLGEHKKNRGTQDKLYDEEAFNNYLQWFLKATRLELCPPAYDEEILEEDTCFDAISRLEYKRLLRDGNQTKFSPVLNFVVIFAFLLSIFIFLALAC
jgi:hypothetical protein